MIDAILHNPSTSTDARDEFLTPLIQCIKEEEEIYKSYWSAKIEESKEQIDAFLEYANKEFESLANVFEYAKKAPKFYFCVSLLGKGRGIGSQEMLEAAVQLPENEEQRIASFFQGFHEMTHQITDQRFFTQLSMEDGSHMQSENVVMITDYEIFKKFDSELLRQYIEWSGSLAGVNSMSEKEFLEFFQLTEQQQQTLNQLLSEL